MLKVEATKKSGETGICCSCLKGCVWCDYKQKYLCCSCCMNECEKNKLN